MVFGLRLLVAQRTKRKDLQGGGKGLAFGAGVTGLPLNSHESWYPFQSFCHECFRANITKTGYGFHPVLAGYVH